MSSSCSARAAIVGRAGSLLRPSSISSRPRQAGRDRRLDDSPSRRHSRLQYTPTIAESRSDGDHSFIVAGRSCLAGYIFGTYAFDEPLQIGSRLTFDDIGAYTLSKATMFNGINLPRVYLKTKDGTIQTIAYWTYEDFRRTTGGR
jgi:carboxynorspermidine decarboxylase